MKFDPLDAVLKARAHGLIALATTAGDDVRRALWQLLAQRESLYWIGPLAAKPVLDAPGRCWLLECALDERSAGLREVLRRDPHAIHAIGVADAALLPQLVHAALVGCIVVVEVEAADDAAAATRAAAIEAGVDAAHVDAALIAGVGADGALALLPPG